MMELTRMLPVTEGSTEEAEGYNVDKDHVLGGPLFDIALLEAGENETSTRQNRQCLVLYEGDTSH